MTEMTSTPNAPNLSGQTALVTGASRGIGRSAALALARAGAHIIAIARTVGGLEELDDEIKAAGGTCSLVPLDLAETESIDQLGPALSQRFPKIDIFVANAALLGELAPLGDIDQTLWRKTFAVNVDANWRLLATLDPLLRASDGARLIPITSRVGGELARAYWGLYGASKAAMEHIFETYALETAKAGVRLSIIDPGPMRTAMRASAMPGEDPMSLPHPDELAPLILHAAAPRRDDGVQRLVFRQWKEDGLI
jgi:NAD(P)-dependent dehydrogenase (short-subunit alcohol dehydrogenase family)